MKFNPCAAFKYTEFKKHPGAKVEIRTESEWKFPP